MQNRLYGFMFVLAFVIPLSSASQTIAESTSVSQRTRPSLPNRSLNQGNLVFQARPDSLKRPGTVQQFAVGTAGCSCNCYPEILAAIVPKDATLITSSSSPTLLFYVPPDRHSQSKTIWAEFDLRTADDQTELYRISFPALPTGGIVAISLPEKPVLLQPGKEHRWSLSLICDRTDLSSSQTVTGEIRRIELNSSEQTQLQQSSLQQRLTRYASLGLWPETLETLTQLLQENPQSVHFQKLWKTLLQSQGLGNVADRPLLEFK